MKAYKHLVKFALAQNHIVSVWDGGEWQVKRSSSYKAIIEAIESVEAANLVIRNSQGDKVGWAMVMAFGLEDDETVADYTVTNFMNEWEAAYKLSMVKKYA